MNVWRIYQTVINNAVTHLAATHAIVTAGMNWTVIITHALILMSVLLIMENVNKIVTTQMVAIIVLVKMATQWMTTEKTAQVDYYAKNYYFKSIFQTLMSVMITYVNTSVLTKCLSMTAFAILAIDPIISIFVKVNFLKFS